LEGSESEITDGLEWVAETGVRVDPVSGDMIEG
ncbi:MAG: FeS-binding protein, partial [Chloroflexi bacterium]|nr:FeS-binding protein [Chloroflexota bacterium]